MRFITVEEHYANERIIAENERCRAVEPGAGLRLNPAGRCGFLAVRSLPALHY